MSAADAVPAAIASVSAARIPLPVRGRVRDDVGQGGAHVMTNGERMAAGHGCEREAERTDEPAGAPQAALPEPGRMIP